MPRSAKQGSHSRRLTTLGSGFRSALPSTTTAAGRAKWELKVFVDTCMKQCRAWPTIPPSRAKNIHITQRTRAQRLTQFGRSGPSNAIALKFTERCATVLKLNVLRVEGREGAPYGRKSRSMPQCYSNTILNLKRHGKAFKPKVETITAGVPGHNG